MISNFNKAYAITPLVDEMIDEVDRIRVKYTKTTGYVIAINVFVFLTVLFPSLYWKEYTNVIPGLMNIVIPLFCVNRYFKTNHDIMTVYKKARDAIYGETYENTYLNEERMFILYGDLRDRYALVKERCTDDLFICSMGMFVEALFILVNII